MKKISIELPKYRLQLHLKLVKRRKPLVDKSLLPIPSVVNKKYRKGTLLGKTVRHISERKNIKKLFAGILASVVVTSSLLPISQSNVRAASSNQGSDGEVIQTQNTLDTEKSIQYPFPEIKVNQGFSIFHPGVDLGAPVGTPIKPVKAGTVIEANYVTDGYGNTILIDHGNGLTSRYAHLSKIEVKVGDEVTTETEIGMVGLTGHTTGPHLHLEIRQNGVPLNPLTVLSQ
jgi:murein DD-endopeptidase MepM/ murein hydrolase activator NlpD